MSFKYRPSEPITSTTVRNRCLPTARIDLETKVFLRRGCGIQLAHSDPESICVSDIHSALEVLNMFNLSIGFFNPKVGALVIGAGLLLATGIPARAQQPTPEQEQKQKEKQARKQQQQQQQQKQEQQRQQQQRQAEKQQRQQEQQRVQQQQEQQRVQQQQEQQR